MLAAETPHYYVLALAVEVVGDVEHHSLDEFKGTAAAVDFTRDVEPLVIIPGIQTGMELYFVSGARRDLRYHLAEWLVVVRVHYVAHYDRVAS